MFSDVEYITYQKFTDIDSSLRKIINLKLGISAGVMRRWAKIYNPPCIVAYIGGVPIGWATFCLNKHAQVFVAKPYRKQGIGTFLVTKILENKSHVIASTYNDYSFRFWSKFSNIEIDDFFIEDNL